MCRPDPFTLSKYVYDREDILFELDSSGNVVTEYLHGPGIDEPVAMIRNNQTYYYHADGLGSIIAITDSYGRVVQRYEYDSFGNITYRQDPNFIQPYTYTGREYDEETGLYYYRNRYYDPKIGRFITQDPIGFWGGINFYSYVGNSPLNWGDPWGLSSLVYDRSDGQIYVYPGGTDTQGPPQAFPSGNNTTNPQGGPFTPGSFGPAPNGTFPVGPYIPTGNDPNSAFGTGFFPIYLPPVPLPPGVYGPPNPPRSGVGIHSGRANRGGHRARTRGCIRTTDPAIDALRNDPPTQITIQD